MIKFLKKGGVVCMMIDQAVSEGKYIDFMGIPAKTSFAIANIAIKYNAINYTCLRNKNKSNEPIQVIIEPSLKIREPFKIIEKLNKSLENIVCNIQANGIGFITGGNKFWD